jgi:uncharacterized membrane protein
MRPGGATGGVAIPPVHRGTPLLPPGAPWTLSSMIATRHIRPPVGGHAGRPGVRLRGAVRRRRRLRTGLVQAGYVLGAVGLAILLPHIPVGVSVDSRRVTEMLIGVGAAFVPFIGIIYSLLFLVVQFGSTTFTPRLNLFRDSPIVWHGFSFFTSVIVFAFTTAITIGKDEQTTLAVPVTVMVVVLVAITVFRALQGSAFRSIQLAATLAAVARRGREVIDDVYPDDLPATAPARDPVTSGTRSAGSTDVLWLDRSATLQTIDVGRLVGLAESADAVIEMCVGPGEVVPEHGRVAVIHGDGDALEHDVIRALHTGIERTFDEDPALSLRVLADIALRALSPAISDPTTAVQALDEIESLLRAIARRDLDVDTVRGMDGQPRVQLRLPTWDDYVGVALDEIIAIGSSSVQVERRMARLLADLAAVVRSGRQKPLQARLSA